MFVVYALNKKTKENLKLGEFNTYTAAQYAIDNELEWDEDDVPEDWKIYIVEEDGEFEAEIEQGFAEDMGFDPYSGCYTYDC